MKKIISFFLMIFLFISFAISAYATEEDLVPPDIPEINEDNIEESNKLIVEYNEKVDEYNEKVQEYNEKIDKTYEIQKEIVDKNNEFVENVENEIKEDTSEERGFENYAINGEDLPSDWSDNTDENNLKTIIVEKSENQSGEKVRAINIHLYLDESYDQIPSNFYEFINEEDFELSEEIKERIVLSEWETIEFDANDKISMFGENNEFAGNIVYIDGQRKWMGANPNFYFFREIEGYTQGLWHQSGDMLASNSTVQESEYKDGGTVHIIEFKEEQKEINYLYDGEVKQEIVYTRTTNISEPLKNVFSVFTYMFHRLGEEPVKMEEPLKDDYIETVEPMALLKEKEEPKEEKNNPIIIIEPEPIVIKETDVPIENTVIEETKENENIVDDEVPLANFDWIEKEKSNNYWALINLILMILTFLGIFKIDKERKYHISMAMFPIIAFLTFILTENIYLPMKLVDKYTIIMLVIFISQILVHTTKKEEDKK